MNHTFSLEHLNTCSADQFCAAMAPIWEHAPWVAPQVLPQRPFASVDALHAAMLNVVARRSEEERVAFFAGHPELAGASARSGTMTEASEDEQGTLGLGQLQGAAAARWDALNQAYRQRFGFPFILCIRRHSLASALLAFETRLDHDRATELRNALDEIAAISRMRLDRCVVDNTTPPTTVFA